jgi:hypothetical protein
VVRLVQRELGVDDDPTGGSTMHEEHREAAERHELAALAHRKAAEQHEFAAEAHRTAAEHNEKGNEKMESFHSQRAMEFSDHAYKLAEEAASKSGEIVSL